MTEVRVPILNSSQPVVFPDGTMTQVFRTWMLTVSRYLPIIGTGSPEGLVDAPQYALYLDQAGAPGAVEYRKLLPDIAGDTKQGWVLV